MPFIISDKDTLKQIELSAEEVCRLEKLDDETGVQMPIIGFGTWEKLLAGYGTQMQSWGSFTERRRNIFAEPMLLQIGAGAVVGGVPAWVIKTID